MTSKRLFMLLAGGLVLLMALGGAGVWFGNDFLRKEAEEISALKVEGVVLEEQQRSLVQAKKDIEKYSDLEQVVRTIVPQDKDQARTVREFVKLANESGIRIAAISFPSSTLGQAPKTTTPAPAPAEGSTETSQPQQPATPAAPKTTQVKPVEGIPGLFQMEINVQSDSSVPVPYGNLIAFLKKLEQNRRTAQVSNLTVSPSAEDRNLVTFSLILNVYIKP